MRLAEILSDYGPECAEVCGQQEYEEFCESVALGDFVDDEDMEREIIGLIFLAVHEWLAGKRFSIGIPVYYHASEPLRFALQEVRAHIGEEDNEHRT